jgi:hypothetical protein
MEDFKETFRQAKSARGQVAQKQVCRRKKCFQMDIDVLNPMTWAVMFGSNVQIWEDWPV